MTSAPGGEASAHGGELVTCARCGATAETLPLTWVCSVERGRRLCYCDPCSREHLRSIEGRLDAEWWG